MSLREEQSIFSVDIVKLLSWASEQGYEYTYGEFHRPIQMQEIHYKAGRSKTMNSQHLKKLAADIFFFKDGKFLASKAEVQPIGDAWERLSSKNRWGGNWNSFRDIPHFERQG